MTTRPAITKKATSAVSANKPKDPMDIILALSDSVEKFKTDTNRRATELQNDFEAAALEISQHVEKANTDLTKLRQLQELLQSINS